MACFLPFVPRSLVTGHGLGRGKGCRVTSWLYEMILQCVCEREERGREREEEEEIK